MSRKLLTQVALGLTLVAPVMQANQAVQANTYSYAPQDCDIDEAGSKDKDKKGEGIGEGNGPAGDNDWITPGTETYKVAQNLFDALTKEFGVSGAFAAGMIANAKGESNLVPDLGESAHNYPFAVRRFGMNSKERKEGMGPSTAEQENRYGPDYFGGGMFQITPWQKFADSEHWQKIDKDQGWAPANQFQHIWDMEFGNKMVHSMYNYHLTAGLIGGAADAGARLGTFGSIEDALSTEDPAKAQSYFQIGYERPQWYHPEREDWARKANEVFNKDNVKADPSKWKFSDKAGTSTTSNISVESKNKGAGGEDDCGPTNSKKKKGGSYADWGNDGTGTHNYSDWDAWKPSELPDDLKQYALDPESIGMMYNSSEGWSAPSDQCVGFSVSFNHALWKKDGQGVAHIPGNGVDNARELANIIGGETVDTPKKGALASYVASSAPAPYGHVINVSHVFENGDILLIEQNTPKSGAGAGEMTTWNYRIALKATYEAEGWEFISPGDHGYEHNKDIKTME